nr:hypothetical protein CFP56_23451 [Quercus suber]
MSTVLTSSSCGFSCTVEDSSSIEAFCCLDSIADSGCLKVETLVDTCTSLSTSSSSVLDFPSIELPSLQ